MSICLYRNDARAPTMAAEWSWNAGCLPFMNCRLSKLL
jgi:hypothetical protein